MFKLRGGQGECLGQDAFDVAVGMGWVALLDSTFIRVLRKRRERGSDLNLELLVVRLRSPFLLPDRVNLAIPKHLKDAPRQIHM